MAEPRVLALLAALLARPTAPFREMHVREVAEAWCARRGLPCHRDGFGNLAVGAASPRAWTRLLRSGTAAEPVRLFVAHMDHPGFHGVRWLGPARLEARWLGGGPVRHLRGARVWLADAEGERGAGRIVRARLHPSGRWPERLELAVELDGSGRRPAARALFGGLAFRAPWWRRGRRLHARVCDDLVGVWAALEAAAWGLARGRPVAALLTRGEEVGFTGLVAHLESLPRPPAGRRLVAVSLETSRQLPGAGIGGGPVVRLGDRRTVFDPDATEVLALAARRALPGAHQRRLMDGGACEATAAPAWGLPAVGISVPLGNYHNQGFEGGPDCRGREGPAPEHVDLADALATLRLCRALARPGLPWADPWAAARRRLARNLARHRARARVPGQGRC